MLGRRNREPPAAKAEPTPFAARAKDLGALRDAVVDAAGVGTGLWLSYLFALFYFAIAAGAVTHRDLFLENPVKLPFLNVELPLKAFFVLGPLVFLIVHAYVLLHFVLLAGKVGAFDAELEAQIDAEMQARIPGDEAKARLRRQLPSNIFVQSLAGPRDVRKGVNGFLLRLVIRISLVAAPIALLVLFQLQFLPYHNEWITSWQRIAVVIDLILLWLLWPPIARGGASRLGWSDFKRGKVLAWAAVSTLPVLLVVTIATFPGEWLEENLPALRFVPTGWPPWKSGRTSLHQLLVAGGPDYVAQRPRSLWSNVLVLPNFAAGDRVKFVAEGKMSVSSERLSLRGRSLEGAVLVGARLGKADFVGAQLQGASLDGADLHEAKVDCAEFSYGEECAQLQGASLDSAQLQGASLDFAQLQGALLDNAQLQGSSLRGAQLQGASLDSTELQGAMLAGAQLQGTSLDDAHLQGAFLETVFVWRTKAPTEHQWTEGAWIVQPEPEAKYRRFGCRGRECVWTEATFGKLKSLIEGTVPAGSPRDQALRRIAKLKKPPYSADEASAEAWSALGDSFLRMSDASYIDTLAKTLIRIGCRYDGAPYVIHGLTEQLHYRFRYVASPREAAEIADAFLDEANCASARGLSERDKAELRRIHGLAPKSSAPGPVSGD